MYDFGYGVLSCEIFLSTSAKIKRAFFFASDVFVGPMYFSNNFKKFLLSTDIKDKYNVLDITKESFDKDFESSSIHHCFKITHQKER